MEKSPGAFRTISEVAEDIDLPQHVLRFWETRFSHVKPLKRGGGRRYYRPDDVDLLKGIRHLLYGEGYTIRGVQRILKAEGVRFVQAIGRGEDVLSSSLAVQAENGIEDGVIALPEPEGETLEASPLLSDRDLQLLHHALGELREAARVLSFLSIADERGVAQEP